MNSSSTLFSDNAKTSQLLSIFEIEITSAVFEDFTLKSSQWLGQKLFQYSPILSNYWRWVNGSFYCFICELIIPTILQWQLTKATQIGTTNSGVSKAIAQSLVSQPGPSTVQSRTWSWSSAIWIRRWEKPNSSSSPSKWQKHSRKSSVSQILWSWSRSTRRRRMCSTKRKDRPAWTDRQCSTVW